MSPVIWGGSVSEISPRRSFNPKNFMCSYEKPGWPGCRDLGFCDRHPGNGDETFTILILRFLLSFSFDWEDISNTQDSV